MKLSRLLTVFSMAVYVASSSAQTVNWIQSTEKEVWKQSQTKLTSKVETKPLLVVDESNHIVTFKKWGTCFNELGWDALNILPIEEQNKFLSNVFAPDGELKFSMGRIPMNANDYARDWYSCDEVSGDFKLHYFNIDRDKKTLIPYVKRALKLNPNMTFWVSPWSPPSWLKINNYYAVNSSAKVNKLPAEAAIALYEGKDNKDKKYYPRQVTENDYVIQDPRYLQCYADYFCKFVSMYQEMGIPVNRVMFQNEPWAYSIYPACAWTPEGIIRFNVEYLSPTVKAKLPGVQVYLGTLNTNRLDCVEKVLSDPRMKDAVEGIDFQWWGGGILPQIRTKYPNYKYMQTESECGSGTFDWKAAEHTYNLINHYLGNGCEEYTIWNAILCDKGTSAWGWNQNALVRVDSKTSEATYTPEYYAVKHFSNVIGEGTRILSYREKGEDGLPIMVCKNVDGKFVVVAANFNDTEKQVTLQLGAKYLNVTLQGHSFNTFCIR